MSITLDEFVRSITTSGLMEAQEIQPFLDKLPMEQQPKTAEDLAKEQQFPACRGNFRPMQRTGSLGKPWKNVGQLPLKPLRPLLPRRRRLRESVFAVTPYFPVI